MMRSDILKVALEGSWPDYRDLMARVEIITDCKSAEHAASYMFRPDTIPSEHLQKIWLTTLTMKLQGRCAES